MGNSFSDSSGQRDMQEENVTAGELGATSDGTKTTLLPPTGDYLRIGDAGATSHSLDANDDLLVSGELEVDGATFIDGALTAAGTVSSGDITISDATPVINFKDSSCTDADVNALIKADATDTGTGAEDIDVTMQQQVAGTPTTFLSSDADGALVLGQSGQAITLNGTTTVGILNATTGLTIGTDKFVTVTAYTSAGINAAIDALGTTGGEVYLPEGDYDCTATITIDANNTTLRGAGRGTRLLATNRLVYSTITGTPVAGQTMTGDTTGYTAVCEQVDLVNKIVWYHTISNAANFSATENISWTTSGADTLVNGSAPTEQSFNVITTGTFSDTVIRDLQIVGGSGGGNTARLIGGGTANTRLKVENCYLFQSDDGSIRTAGDDVKIINNYIYKGDAAGITLLSTSANYLVSGNTIIGCGAAGVNVAAGDYGRILGNYFESLIGTTISVVAAYNIVKGNIIKTAASYGIQISGGGTYCSIIGNSIYGTATGVSDIQILDDHNIIVGNTCLGLGTSDKGIYLDEADYCVVEGNVTSGHDVAGIQIDSDCQDTVLLGNNCTDTVPYVNNGIYTMSVPWRTWTPTLTWGTADPASLTTVARYKVTDGVVKFKLYITSADANACSSLTATLPITPADINSYTRVSSLQLNDATYLDPMGYIDQLDGTAGNRLLKFYSFATVADTKTVTIEVSGEYEM